jgi:hypothetical protein
LIYFVLDILRKTKITKLLDIPHAPGYEREDRQQEKEDSKPLSKSIDRASIFLNSPELTKQYEMRSSRDRVARGAFLNVLMLTISATLLCPCSKPYLPLFITLPAGLFLTGVCFAMWFRFNRLTSRFKHGAYQAIASSKRKPPKKLL